MPSSPYIYWQYPGEDLHRTIATDYNLEESFKPAQCETEYYVTGAFSVQWWTWGRWGRKYYKTAYPYVDSEKEDIKIIGAVKNITINSVEPCPEDENSIPNCDYGGRQIAVGIEDAEGLKGFIVEVWSEPFGEGGVIGLGKTSFWHQETLYSLEDPPFIWRRKDGLPDNCGAECKFTVYRNNLIVHQETRDKCPEIWRIDDCPPGTCEVECGSHICCYRPDGVSVKSIQR